MPGGRRGWAGADELFAHAHRIAARKSSPDRTGWQREADRLQYGMKIFEIMTPHAECVEPDSSIVTAAAKMRALNVGALLVCEGDRLAGIVTDRDMALRCVAEARDPAFTTVRSVMSPGIIYVFEDQDAEEAARLMEMNQVRRLPVLNREKRLVGIISLGDLAVDAGAALSGGALKEISRPLHHAATA